jgi:hypothetical protein
MSAELIAKNRDGWELTERGKREVERFRGLQIDHQFEF